jgi:class 3 adenylate cyclase
VFAGDHRTPSRSNSIALSARSSGFLRNGETVIADRVVESTILFCDLVGFTTLSQTLPADRVIDFLNKIFSAFARLLTLNSLPS